MNKPMIITQSRVDDEFEGGGTGLDFDPISFLSTKKADTIIGNIIEPPVEDVLMSKTLWPEQ